MPGIFISYCRESGATVKALADDMEALGHNVWFDQDLSGGRAWWDQILAQIRDCDLLVFALSSEALTSTACAREWGYAADLGKPILPVLAANGVSTGLLPPRLSTIHYVDYRKQDSKSALSLAKALRDVPPPRPLPDPLPQAPEAPVSYLGGLSERIESPATLDYADQSALVVDLGRGLRDPETAGDAGILLDRLRKRRDLFAAIADEIDTLRTRARAGDAADDEADKTAAGAARPTPRAPPPAAAQPEAGPKPASKGRLKGSLVGGVAGILAGLAALLSSNYDSEELLLSLVPGFGGAIAGAIAATDRRLIASTLTGAALGWFAVGSLANPDVAIVAGLIIGAPFGAVVGAIAGAILRRLLKWA